MNICVDCKHCVRREPDIPRASCDYNILCGGFDDEMVPCQDPVLGLEGYGRRNDMGGFIFCATIEEARPTCRSKNLNGECERFEA